MNSAPFDSNPERSPTWLKKGVETLTRMARIAPSPSRSKGNPNPLRELFSDLMAYVIFFEGSCEQQPPALNEVRERIVALINSQEERAKTSGVAIDTYHEARFAVLSWTDEIILNSKWLHRAQWQHLMLAYHGTVNGGEEFFRHLNALPPQANDIREIYYLCICLGFQGEFAFGDGRRELYTLKQRLYKQLCATNGDMRQNYSRIFPEAYQKANVAPSIPPKSNQIWYIVAISVPVLLFGTYWFLLSRQATRITEILRQAPSTITTKCDVQNWAGALVTELRAKGLRAVDEPEGVRIILESLVFAPGSAELGSKADAKIREVVTTVKCYAPDKYIAVEGHASREREGTEATNRKLSEDRARTVANAFERIGFSRERISATGFGSSKPVALNDTEEGRSQNRRVEIIVKK